SLCFACSTNSKTNGAGGGGGTPSNTGAGTGGNTTTGGTGGTNTGGSGGTNSAGVGGKMGGGTGGTDTGGTNNGGTDTAGTGGTVAASPAQSVTQRGGDSARTAHWVDAAFTTANVGKMAFDADFKANFTGEMSAVPLFLAGTKPGKGIFFA